MTDPREAVKKSRTRHLARRSFVVPHAFRLNRLCFTLHQRIQPQIDCLTTLVRLHPMPTLDDREVNVIVDINVFHSNLQAGRVRADVTYVGLKIVHHHVLPSFPVRGVGLMPFSN
jgi:hypothetical protein